MLATKQRRSRLAHFVNVRFIVGRIAHRYDDIHRIAKLLMNRL